MARSLSERRRAIERSSATGAKPDSGPAGVRGTHELAWTVRPRRGTLCRAQSARARAGQPVGRIPTPMSECSTLPAPDARASLSRDLGLIAVLLLAAAAVHLWLVRHTVVLARDGIGFIHYAWQFEHLPWRTALASTDQHPGYPLVVMAMSWPVRYWHPGSDAETMALAAQLASVVASCLLVVPVFYLGRALFDRRVGFWAALLLECLPVSARVTSDALSEATFLLAAVVTVLVAVRALTRGGSRWFALCGLGGALTYLVRPEGALTVAAIGLVLAAMQMLPAWRRPWRQALGCAVSLLVAAAALAGPYMVAVGGFTVKPTGQDVLKMEIGHPAHSVRGAPEPDEPLAASVLGIWWPSGKPGDYRDRVGWSLWAVGTEVTRASYYVVWPAALLGMCWFHKRLRSNPAAWVILTLGLLQTAAVWRVAVRMGYVSERHVLLILLVLLFWAAAALVEAPRRLLGRHEGQGGAVPELAPMRRQWYTRAACWPALLPLLLVGAALPKTLQPLHANEGRHRAAGHWLAEHAGPDDVIVDPFHWAGYYAGRAFRPDPPPGTVPAGAAQYVVLESARTQHTKEQITADARALAARGQLVHRVRPARQNAGDLEIYRVAPVDAAR